MATEKQIAANRQNAKRSTGPRTTEGKAVACRNATRHGLLAAKPVLEILGAESVAAYELLRDRLFEEYRPVGVIEELLVDQMASQSWRLTRLSKVEADLYARDYHDRRAKQAARVMESLEVAEQHDASSAEPSAGASCHRTTDAEAYAKAEQEKRCAEAARDAATPVSGMAFQGESGARFALVHRYEVGMQHGLLRLVHEFVKVNQERCNRELHQRWEKEKEIEERQRDQLRLQQALEDSEPDGAAALDDSDEDELTRQLELIEWTQEHLREKLAAKQASQNGCGGAASVPPKPHTAGLCPVGSPPASPSVPKIQRRAAGLVKQRSESASGLGTGTIPPPIAAQGSTAATPTSGNHTKVGTVDCVGAGHLRERPRSVPLVRPR